MSASMASVSMRKVASPRRIAGAVTSPQVQTSLKTVFRHAQAQAQAEPWSPNSFTLLKPKESSSLSPFVARVLSPSPVKSDSRSPRVKSARKLPWSDGGKHSGLGVSGLAGRKLALCDPLEDITEVRTQLSVDTPDRAETLKCFGEDSSLTLTLGKGSFGTVIEAFYHGKTVAVKIVQSTLEAHRQLQNEMNCLKLSHPNIVRIFKIALPNNATAGIVIMERVYGYSLQKLLDNDLLKDKVKQRIRYSMQISSALAYCHKEGVLHLDVKPQNVLVDVLSDCCRLCDFGCSSSIEPENFSFKGTVAYMAPEILQGSKPTPAADVYSLGITMWQLLSGESPYNDLRGHTVIYRVVAVSHRPRLPTTVCAEDVLFLKLIKKCWSQSDMCRPTIQEVIEDLSMQIRHC